MMPHNRPTIEEDDIKNVVDVLKSGWIAPGKVTKLFEKKICEYLGIKGYASAVDSGTSAIFLALKALGVNKNHEVIVPTYVCTAVLNAVNYIGAKIILVDIDENSFNLSYHDIENKVTHNTGAIILPYMYGYPAPIERFEKFGIPIIENCAQSLGTEYRGKKLGAFGDVSVFSFNATKPITTARGGMIVSEKKEIIDKINDYINYDCRKEYVIRYNSKMSDLQASLGLSQLEKLDFFIEKRTKIAKKYDRVLSKKKACRLKPDENTKINNYRYVILHEEYPKKIKEEFIKLGISTINPIERWELLHRYLKLDPADFPNAEVLVKKTLSIPIFPALEEGNILKICKAVGDILE